MLNQSADLDRLFQALADPARRAIVARLSLGPAPVSELARPLPMALPAAMELAAPEKIQSMKKELMTKTTPTSIHASGRKAWSWSCP